MGSAVRSESDRKDRDHLEEEAPAPGHFPSDALLHRTVAVGIGHQAKRIIIDS